MPLRDTPGECPTSSVDLAGLMKPTLPKHCQQNDAAARCDPIRHPYRISIQEEPQLAKLAIELLRLRLA
jgi:hypothetical protein